MTGRPRAARWTARLAWLAEGLFPRWPPFWRHFWLGVLMANVVGLVALFVLTAWMAAT